MGEATCSRRRVEGELVHGLLPVDEDRDGVLLAPAFGAVDARYCCGIEGDRTDAVDGVGGKHHQAAALQNAHGVGQPSG
jgi:hypothetical protein